MIDVAEIIEKPYLYRIVSKKVLEENNADLWYWASPYMDYLFGQNLSKFKIKKNSGTKYICIEGWTVGIRHIIRDERVKIKKINL